MTEPRVSDGRLAEMVRYGDGVGAELHPLALDLCDARAECKQLRETLLGKHWLEPVARLRKTEAERDELRARAEAAEKRAAEAERQIDEGWMPYMAHSTDQQRAVLCAAKEREDALRARCEALAGALSDAIETAQAYGPPQSCGDHHVYTPQIGERHVATWRAALARHREESTT